MIQALEEGRLIAVSDASVSADGLESHAYTIVSKDKVDRIQGSAPVDCEEDDIESTRAEKCGIFVALTIINVLATMSSATTNPISIYCDNLDAATKKTRPSRLLSVVKFMGANYDLDAEITRTINNISNGVILIHIDGHQDDAKDFNYDSSPLPVRFNIDMDEAAKQFLREDQGSLNPTRITPYYLESLEALCIHGSAVTISLDAHVKLHKNGPKVEKRLA